MGKYEDLIEKVRDLDEDIAEELESFKGSSLRSKAERTDTLEKEKADLEARISELEEAPKREKAFKDFGVDLDGLKPAEVEILKSLKLEGELTAEKIGEVVAKYDLPMTAGSEAEETEEPSAAEVISRAAQTPGQAGTKSTISAADMESWPTDRLMRFRQKYPEQFEALKREQVVTGSFDV